VHETMLELGQTHFSTVVLAVVLHKSHVQSLIELVKIFRICIREKFLLFYEFLEAINILLLRLNLFFIIFFIFFIVIAIIIIFVQIGCERHAGLVAFKDIIIFLILFLERVADFAVGHLRLRVSEFLECF
jgi:hypothetical protein